MVMWYTGFIVNTLRIWIITSIHNSSLCQNSCVLNDALGPINLDYGYQNPLHQLKHFVKLHEHVRPLAISFQ